VGTQFGQLQPNVPVSNKRLIWNRVWFLELVLQLDGELDNNQNLFAVPSMFLQFQLVKSWTGTGSDFVKAVLQPDAELNKSQNQVPSSIYVPSVPVSKKRNWNWVGFSEPVLQPDAELDKNQNWVPSPIDVLSVPVSKKLNWNWVWFFGASSATGDAKLNKNQNQVPSSISEIGFFGEKTNLEKKKAWLAQGVKLMVIRC